MKNCKTIEDVRNLILSTSHTVKSATTTDPVWWEDLAHEMAFSLLRLMPDEDQREIPAGMLLPSAPAFVSMPDSGSQNPTGWQTVDA